MSSGLDRAVRDIIAAIQESGRSKTSPFDRTAKVVRVDEEAGIAWVHFPGGVDETPVNLTIAATAGDTVQVRSGGGKAWITGNATAPPTDDTTAKIAKLESLIAGKRSQKAKETADNAVVKAENAVSDAIEALEKANDSLATDTLHYLATPLSSGVTRDTQGWTTTVQTMTKTNKYLWTYHTYTTADGTTTNTDPIITGTYGEKGDNGDKGDKGDKGDSPTITTTKDGKTTTIKADGVSIGTVIDGADGSSPTVSKSGKVVTITDASGTTVTVSDGEDGASIKGDDGEDAYFHVAWANSSDGTEDFSTTVATNKLYMGTYTDHTSADSTSPSKYKWVKVKGEQGVQGVQGVQGESGHSPVVTASKSGDTTTIKVDGTTIATILDGIDGDDGHSPAITTQKSGNTTTIYADGTAIGTVVDGDDGTTPMITATKSGSTTTVKVNGTTIATINDGTDGYSPTATVTKSGNTATITITDKNGTTTKTVTDGTDGDDGVSITAVQPQYYLSTSSSSATGGSWSNSLTYVSGKYIWTREQISYSNNTTGYSTAIYNQALTQACSDAMQALEVAQEVNQYTWHTETDTGAGAGTHITSIPQDEFEAYPSGLNVLIDSVGAKIRNALKTMASYGLKSVIGEANKARVEIAPTVLEMISKDGATAIKIESSNQTAPSYIAVNINIPILYDTPAEFELDNTIPVGTVVTVEILDDAGYFLPTDFTIGTPYTYTDQYGYTIAYDGAYGFTATCTQAADALFTVSGARYTQTVYVPQTTLGGMVKITDTPFNSYSLVAPSISITDTYNGLVVNGVSITRLINSPNAMIDATGLTPVSSRCKVTSGGVIKVGKWRFVQLVLTIKASLSANNTWGILDGFDIANTSIVALASSVNKNYGNVSAQINASGRLVVQTSGQALAADNVLTVSGFYIAQ